MQANYKWKWDDQDEWVEVYVNPQTGSVTEVESGYVYTSRWKGFEDAPDICIQPITYPIKAAKTVDPVNNPAHYGQEQKKCYRCQEDKPLEAFAKNKAKPDGLQERCKDCCKSHYHNSGYTKRQRELSLKKKYGMSLLDYDLMVDEQGGQCAICGAKEKLYVDHNHDTGKIRGLLCNTCNRAIGLLRDDSITIYKAAEYVENDGA